MPIFRQEKGDTPYTRTENVTMQDSRLSWKARGLLAYMLTKPDDWKFYIEELVTHATDGLDSTRAGIKELEKFGYFKRYPVKEKGKIVSWVIDIYEVPQLEKPQMEKPHVENPMLLTNEVLTNDYTNELKTYIDFPIDDVYLKIYYECFVKHFKKSHMKVTESQHHLMVSSMDYLRSCGVEKKGFKSQAVDHFKNLPEGNNGNMLAFIHSFPRRFELDFADWKVIIG